MPAALHHYLPLFRSLQESEKKIHTLVSELEDERTSSTTPRKLSSSSLDTDVRQQNQQLSVQVRDWSDVEALDIQKLADFYSIRDRYYEI